MSDSDQPWPSGRQILGFIGGGCLVALSSCFGMTSSTEVLLVPMFFAGVVAILIGILLALVRLISQSVDSIRGVRS